MSKSIKSLSIICVAAAILLLYGCPGTGTPKIVLSVTDCEVNKITIEKKTLVTTPPGSQWNLKTTIIVKCDGVPVNDAELKVEFWWPNGTFVRKTNSEGKIEFIKNGQGSPPYGSKFKVTIKGNDDEKTEEFELERNNP